MTAARRLLVLLPFVLGCLLPGAARGFVLCLDEGPDGHVAIERGCDSVSDVGFPNPRGAGSDPAALSLDDCAVCLDIPLEPVVQVRSQFATPGPVAVSPPPSASLFAPPALRPAEPPAFVPAAPPPAPRAPARLLV